MPCLAVPAAAGKSKGDLTCRGNRAPGCKRRPGTSGFVVVTSYQSHIYSHPGEPCTTTVDVMMDDTGQVLTYRADRLRPLVDPAASQRASGH